MSNPRMPEIGGSAEVATQQDMFEIMNAVYTNLVERYFGWPAMDDTDRTIPDDPEHPDEIALPTAVNINVARISELLPNAHRDLQISSNMDDRVEIGWRDAHTRWSRIDGELAEYTVPMTATFLIRNNEEALDETTIYIVQGDPVDNGYQYLAEKFGDSDDPEARLLVEPDTPMDGGVKTELTRAEAHSLRALAKAIPALIS